MSKQLLIANVNQIGSKGTVEKYTNENTIFESTPKLTIVDIGQTSEVTLQGTFIATAFHARSDRRLKENIADLKNSLDIVKQLDPKEYNFIDSGNKKSYGFIAQEIEEILPELVADDANGVKSISYGEIIPILTNAIKELNTKIIQLEKNSKEKNTVEELRDKIEILSNHPNSHSIDD